MEIYFDIETVPGQRAGLREELAEDIKHPATMSKPETIAKWEKEDKPAAVEQAYRNTSFDGGMGQIVCIGWAIGISEPVASFAPDLTLVSEECVIRSFFERLATLHSTSGTRPILIGHNHIAFDIPFIWKRAMVHNIKPPMWFPRNPKPWSESVVDTMMMWDSTGRPGKIMDKICRALGIPGKGEVSGADVWPMAQRGEFDLIEKYCREDVDRTRKMWRRMNFEPA